MNSAVLALEDGTVFEGSSFGAPVERAGEVVFNTAITGYQEIFTDPSYSGQIVVLTNPQIGNYGANANDSESSRPYIEGLAVREFSPLASNWRSDETAQSFLTNNGVPVVPLSNSVYAHESGFRIKADERTNRCDSTSIDWFCWQ